jgi:transposase-like protein
VVPEVRASFAAKLRRRRPRPGDNWHLDKVFIRIQGGLHYLWRAVDQDGIVLDILEQGRRDGGAAKRFFKRLLKVCSMCRGSSSPTSWAAMAWRSVH